MHPLAPPAPPGGLEEDGRPPARAKAAGRELLEVIGVIRVGQRVHVSCHGGVVESPAGEIGGDARPSPDAGQVVDGVTTEDAAYKLREHDVPLAGYGGIDEGELADRLRTHHPFAVGSSE